MNWAALQSRFRPRLLGALQGYNRQRLGADIAAGLTVGVVALPLAMAFAIASGVKPEQGIVTAIVAGFLISALGGSHVQIGGPAGAFIVIVFGIVERYGLANLLISTALAGMLLFAMGWFRMGAWVRYLPVPIIIGFTNGIAVLIILSQLRDFFGLVTPKLSADFFALLTTLVANAGSVNFAALAVAGGSLAVVACWPALGRWAQAASSRQRAVGSVLHWASKIPGTVVVLLVATAATQLLALPIETIGSRFGGIPRSLPDITALGLSWAAAKQLFIPTLTIALLGAVESLLCARVADNASALQRHDPNQELMAQGIANIVTPLFGGIPATGTLARTMTNVRAGATSPVAGMVHAIVLLLIVLVGAPLAYDIPLAAMSGILVYVGWNMGEWREFTRLRHFSAGYRSVLLGTFVLTVVFDLMVAVEVGLVLACLFFIYRMSALFSAELQVVPQAPPRTQVVALFGSLFFGATPKLELVPQLIDNDSTVLVLDAHKLISMDTSGLDALEQLHAAMQRRGVAVLLCGLNAQPLSLIERSGFLLHLGNQHVHATLAEALESLLLRERVGSH